MSTDYGFCLGLKALSILAVKLKILINDLARIVMERVASVTDNREVGIQYSDAMVDYSARKQPDCSLARRLLDWIPRVELSSGSEHNIAWHMQRTVIRDWIVRRGKRREGQVLGSTIGLRDFLAYAVLLLEVSPLALL